MALNGPSTPIIASCYGCGLSLATSPLIALISGHHHQWHTDCLRCSECEESLSTERSCYLKNGRIYCKKDYLNLVRANVKCSKCFRIISPNDWVRRAGSHVYHLACFACDLCQRQMSTGEQFTIDNATEDMKLLCKLHFGITTTSEGDSHDSSSNDSLSSSTPKPSKTKRVRTTFTEEQLQILQANFQIDSNPDGQDLERIATLTGLSKRVTQVWFQNSRARQKKHLNRSRGPETGPTSGLTGCGLGSGTSGSSWGNPGEVTNSNQSWSLSNNLCSDGNSN
uniref:Arrowhead n=2 Tax=Tetranychus urticae TaxID=32264 RepID=T1KKP6_TETUR